MENVYYTGQCDIESPTSIYMNRNFVTQRDFYNNLGACFVNEQKDICRQIIDPWGRIRNFPGVRMTEQLQKAFSTFDAEPLVRIRVRFGPFDGEKILMVWTIRADGREWMDHDGFGEDDDPSVRLYTYLDKNGDFTGPFRLYAIGDRLYGDLAFSDDICRYRDLE